MRAYYFHANGDPTILIGSADWRRRNLEDRVEALVPIQDPALQERILSILETALRDNSRRAGCAGANRDRAAADRS